MSIAKSIARRRSWGVAALLSLSLGLSWGNRSLYAASFAPRPNIIFILTDDQGYGDLSCHGNPILKTPNIDRLHDEGVRFRDFQVSPTCSPTRSALLTGRHEFRNGVTHTILERERLTLRATTIAQVLQTAGYRTGIFGKWHLGDQPEYQPNRRGFDEVFIHGGGGIGQTYRGSCGDAPGNTYFNPAILHNGRFVKTQGYCTDVFFAQALRWIEAEKGRQPFFAYIACNAPHAPLQVRPEDEQRYAGQVPPNAAKFFGMIANIDDNVGKLLERIKEWGLEQNTLIIFMNDNGGTAGVSVFNAGMRGTKGTPWLGGTRAASFWCWPGQLKPASVDALTAHIDFFPTLAQLAGVTLSEALQQQVEGRSLAPLLENPAAPWPDRTLFTHFGRWEHGQVAGAKYRQCSVRNTQWHLVNVSRTGQKEWQLFDVKTDLVEKQNVAAQYPEIVQQLDVAYDQWWDSIQPQLVNENADRPEVNPFREMYWKQYARQEQVSGFTSSPATLPKSHPNVVLILADDLGYGDVSCYGATKVQTPNLDRLARAGLRFTDAHASSATCTPSRYALLTGEYPWRKKGTGILPGDAALIIEPGRTTLPSMLKAGGYVTGVVGKWHLGLGNKGTLDWNKEIKPGPLEIGFDYSFIMPATGDRVPCVYMENRRVVGLDPKDPLQVSFGKPIGQEPTGKTHPELLKMHPSHGHDQTIINGISRIGYMSGGTAARWVDEDMADTFTQNAIRFMERSQIQPFFLYFATHDIHVPRVPHSRFAGKSGLGPRGDVILQFDWCVGEILDTLDRLNLAQDTLVIVTSDNGPVVDDGYQDQAVEKLSGHKPAGPWRGGKYSAFEGGTRVPFLARWPRHIKPGESPALVSQIDLLATLAALTGQTLTERDAPDSQNVLAAVLGKSSLGRDHLVEQAGVLALRQGTWKYIEPGKGPKVNANTNTETGQAPSEQLYDLSQDLAETNNLATQQPDKVDELKSSLRRVREPGRSQPLPVK